MSHKSSRRAHRLDPAIIAIDGPAASGKSTVGHAVAAALDFLFFDTGVMYRAVTAAALARGVDTRDAAATTGLAEDVHIDVHPSAPDDDADGRHATVLVDGVDVTWAIRTPEVDQHVSRVSAHPGVRRALSAQQRRIGHRYGSGQAGKPGIVMVGRDIGTVVLPDAGLKIYMDATPEERARRRWRELTARGQTADYDDVLRDIEARDRHDSERALSPLRAADDAVVLDTSRMSVDEVTRAVLELAGVHPV